MKKLLFLLLLAPIFSFGQTPISNNFQLNAGKSLDNRTHKNSAENPVVSIPYLTTSEANTAISSARRYEGLTVCIGAANNCVEYWYHGGTADGNLVMKFAGGGSTDSSIYLTKGLAAGTYQTKLVSGTNIKTINGTSLLGSGDIAIGGGGGNTALSMPSAFNVAGSGTSSITVTAPGNSTTQYINGAGGASLVSNLPISTAVQTALNQKQGKDSILTIDIAGGQDGYVPVYVKDSNKFNLAAPTGGSGSGIIFAGTEIPDGTGSRAWFDTTRNKFMVYHGTTVLGFDFDDSTDVTPPPPPITYTSVPLAYFAKAGIANTADKNATQTLYNSLAAIGGTVLADMRLMYLGRGATITAQAVNFIDTSKYNGVPYGGMVYNDSGFHFDGVNDYLDPNFVPYTDYDSVDIFTEGFAVVSPPSSAHSFMGTAGSGYAMYIFSYPTNQFIYKVAAHGITTTPSTNVGVFALKYDGAYSSFYQNNTRVGLAESEASVGATVPFKTVYGAYFSFTAPDNFTDGTFRAFYKMNGIHTDAEVKAINAALTTYIAATQP